MQRTLRIVSAALLCAAFLLPWNTRPASAGSVTIYKTEWQTITALTADRIDSAVWTGWLLVNVSRAAAFEIAFTQNAATAVTMTCQTTNDPTTANGSGFALHILYDSATAGTSDSVPHIWSNAVSGSESWTWTVANLPHDYINCSFTATGGGATDTATVRWRSTFP